MSAKQNSKKSKWALDFNVRYVCQNKQFQQR